MNKARFAAFSDGVFAFAITLLVLGFALPHFADHRSSEAPLRSALLHEWPNLLAYFLSFAVIGIMWQNHNALFRFVRRIDRVTVFLNLILLGITAFIPFATSALGEYPDLRPSTFLYGLTLTASATAYNFLLNHLVRRDAFAATLGEHAIRQTVFAYRVGWTMYPLAMLVSLVSPQLSFALYIMITIFYLIPRGVDADLEIGDREDS